MKVPFARHFFIPSDRSVVVEWKRFSEPFMNLFKGRSKQVFQTGIPNRYSKQAFQTGVQTGVQTGISNRYSKQASKQIFQNVFLKMNEVKVWE